MSTVLIVDDERATRDLLARWLKAAGFETAEAPDADTAIDMMSKQKFAVVTCDKDMPGHNGLWMVEQIKKNHPGVAMLLATGDSEIAPAVSLSKGVQGYLVKPFKREMVVDAVKAAAAWHETEGQQAVENAAKPDPIDEWLKGRAGRPPQDNSQK